MKAIRFLSVAVLPALVGLACSASSEDDTGLSGGNGGSGAYGAYGGTGSGGKSGSGGVGGSVGGAGSGGMGAGGSGGSVTGGAGGVSGTGAAGGTTSGGAGGTTSGGAGGTVSGGGSGGTSTGGAGGSGGGATNDCCTIATTPGCTPTTTQDCVCKQDSFCCTTAWDKTCVQEVNAFNCGSCGSTGGAGGGGGSGGSSGGSGGTTGGGGGTGGTGTQPCCTAASTPGCSNATVQNCVCKQDDYCCKTAWDSMCVKEVDSFGCGSCGGTGGTGGTGGSGGTGGTPGCTGTTAFECGNTGNYCSNGLCVKCAAGTQNCNGIGGCECSGTCNGASCTTCTDVGPEPNDTTVTAASACGTLTCDINDCNSSGSSVSGVIKPGGDVDFFKFKGWDDLCVVDPTVSTNTAGIQACVFAVCYDGSKAFQSCKSGNQATEGSMTGCCTNGAGSASININCPGIFDDATVYIRVKGLSSNACTPYDVSYHY